MAKRDAYHDDLHDLMAPALRSGDRSALERYFVERAKLSRTYANLPLAQTFADISGEMALDGSPVQELLDAWAGLDERSVPVDDDREILPVAGVLAYGQLAAVCPERWDALVGKLHRAASDGRWRIREMVA